MNRMYGRKVCVVESQQQRIFIDVEQMFVRRDQQRNLLKRCFGQDQTVVELVLRDEAAMNEAADELITDRFRCRIQVKRSDAPPAQLVQPCSREFPFRFAVAATENDMHFKKSRRR